MCIAGSINIEASPAPAEQSLVFELRRKPPSSASIRDRDGQHLLLLKKIPI
jgi:hypothetical protein